MGINLVSFSLGHQCPNYTYPSSASPFVYGVIWQDFERKCDFMFYQIKIYNFANLWGDHFWQWQLTGTVWVAWWNVRCRCCVCTESGDNTLCSRDSISPLWLHPSPCTHDLLGRTFANSDLGAKCLLYRWSNTFLNRVLERKRLFAYVYQCVSNRHFWNFLRHISLVIHCGY